MDSKIIKKMFIVLNYQLYGEEDMHAIKNKVLFCSCQVFIVIIVEFSISNLFL